MRYGFISAFSEKNHLAVSQDRNSSQLSSVESKQDPYSIFSELQTYPKFGKHNDGSKSSIICYKFIKIKMVCLIRKASSWVLRIVLAVFEAF